LDQHRTSYKILRLVTGLLFQVAALTIIFGVFFPIVLLAFPAYITALWDLIDVGTLSQAARWLPLVSWIAIFYLTISFLFTLTAKFGDYGDWLTAKIFKVFHRKADQTKTYNDNNEIDRQFHANVGTLPGHEAAGSIKETQGINYSTNTNNNLPNHFHKHASFSGMNVTPDNAHSTGVEAPNSSRGLI
jgi:hypothetical protein